MVINNSLLRSPLYEHYHHQVVSCGLLMSICPMDGIVTGCDILWVTQLPVKFESMYIPFVLTCIVRYGCIICIRYLWLREGLQILIENNPFEYQNHLHNLH